MRKEANLKRIGQEIAKERGHDMTKFYLEIGGYWISQCRYSDHLRMYIDQNSDGVLCLWGNALKQDCPHKESI